MIVSKHVRIVVVGLIAVCTLALCRSSVHAQAPAAEAYLAVPWEPTIADAQCVLTDAGKQLQKQYSAVLKGQTNPPWDDNAQKILDDWYVRYWFPSMSHAINRGKLPEYRTQLIDRDLRTAKNKPAVQHLFDQTLRYMKGYVLSAKSKFHPAVRYNAMLILGDLNQVEKGARGDDPNLPAAAYADPLPAALDFMVAEYNSPTQIDAVRVAAMVGILRHAKLDWARPGDRRIPTPKRIEIVNAMLALLKSAPPAGRTPDGQVWMQRRGIEIVSALGAVGRQPDANNTLQSIVDDQKADFSLRLAAAEALSLYPADAKPPLDALAFARTLGGLAAQACSAEVTRLAAVEKQQKEKDSVRTLLAAVMANPFQVVAASGESQMMSGESYNSAGFEAVSMEDQYSAGDMSMMFGGGYGTAAAGGAVAIPTDPLVNLSRRRLKGQLVIVQNALAKLSTLVKADAQKTQAVDLVATAVKDALAATDPPTGEQDVKGMKKSLETGLKKLKPYAIVAAAAPDALSGVPAPDAAAAAPPAATPEGAATQPGTATPSPAPTAPNPAVATPAPIDPAKAAPAPAPAVNAVPVPPAAPAAAPGT